MKHPRPTCLQTSPALIDSTLTALKIFHNFLFFVGRKNNFPRNFPYFQTFLYENSLEDTKNIDGAFTRYFLRFQKPGTLAVKKSDASAIIFASILIGTLARTTQSKIKIFSTRSQALHASETCFRARVL